MCRRRQEEFNHALEMLNTGCSLEEFLNRRSSQQPKTTVVEGAVLNHTGMGQN